MARCSSGCLPLFLFALVARRRVESGRRLALQTLSHLALTDLHALINVSCSCTEQRVREPHAGQDEPTVVS